MIEQYPLTAIAQLPELAGKLLAFAGPERIILFNGDLGAGKTTFIKAICELLGVTDLVNSPTFSIVNEYEANHEPVYHFDFYRIKNEQEAYDFGCEEYFDSGAYCFIEWPERVAGLLPDKYIEVIMELTDQRDRRLTFQTN